MNSLVASFKIIMFLISLFMLSACDNLELGKERVLPSNNIDSSFFYQLEDTSLKLANEKTIYVPVYSEIFVSGGGKLNLAITLSIRNTDFTYPLIVSSVSYYNTAGELIESYLQTPYLLKPMASTHFFVTQTDKRGGVGANFIVKWSAKKLANQPVIEAVMAGSTGTQGMSFVSTGRLIKSKALLADRAR